MPTRWTAQTWTLVAAVLGSSVVFLDSSVLTVALPAIGKEPRLFVDVLEGQNYIYYGYLLTLSALLVLAGALSDYYGRRRVFVIGLAGFALTSLMCALAPNIEFLIVARLIQGASGAVLVPGSLAILTTSFDGAEQGRAFGVWAAGTAVAPIIGPFVGGVLVDSLSWRWVFLINLPLIAIAAWAAVRYMKESRDEQASGRFDWLGALLVAVAVGGLSFGAIYGQQRQWQDPIAFVALAVGALATVAMPLYFNRVANPLVPLWLFRSRNFSVTNLSTLLIYGALYVLLIFLVLFMQGTLGYSATAAGLTSVPGPLFLVALSTRFGAWAGRVGPRWFMTIGPLIMAIGILWLVRTPADSLAWRFELTDPGTWAPTSDYLLDILPSQLLFGLGLSIMVAPLTTALMRSVPGRVSGLGSAINNAISRVGPQLAGAVIFIVISASFYGALAAGAGLNVNDPQVRSAFQPLNPPPASAGEAVAAVVRQSSTDAFHLAMLVAAGLLIAGAVVNGIFISNRQALAGADAPVS
ncbi:MAG: MFS transporter [Candidatus Limnocylindrales bacterium]